MASTGHSAAQMPWPIALPPASETQFTVLAKVFSSETGARLDVDVLRKTAIGVESMAPELLDSVEEFLRSNLRVHVHPGSEHPAITLLRLQLVPANGALSVAIDREREISVAPLCCGIPIPPICFGDDCWTQ